MLIIPAIDILAGNVVRLNKGIFSTAKKYSSKPVEIAELYDESGFEWLHIVDLSGSLKGLITVRQIVEEIKTKTRLKIEFGGGIRKADDIEDLFSIGVDRVVIGSLPVVNKTEFETVVAAFPVNNIIVAADIENRNVVVKGWSEKTSILIDDYITWCKSYGLNNFLITDISKDGMMQGPNIELYNELIQRNSGIYLIASGGIQSLRDLDHLKNINCSAAVVGKAIYENKINLKELSDFDK